MTALIGAGTRPNVELRNVCLSFPSHTANRRLFRPNSWKGGRPRSVLKKINLSISEGERLALIGANGAGKTTLLRVIAGIFLPTSGKVNVEGAITFLLDTGFGMDSELSGRLNALSFGKIQGLRGLSLTHFISEAKSFSGLGDAFEDPIRTYSSGMQARLVFSLTTVAEPKVLLLDEYFGTGDSSFQEKAVARLDTFIQQSGILITASHNTEFLLRTCTRGVLMDHGEIIFDGGLRDALNSARS